jgi:uncharacterized protein involved in tellurium resistance
MADVTLKRKVTLRRKEEQADFTFGGKLKMMLYWKSQTDLDLCLFFRKKDGQEGGVFSNEYRSKKSDLGSLDQFPYMLHLGDNKEPAPGNEESEQINIARLDDIDVAYAVIINYSAAIEGEDITYAQEGGRIEVQSDSGDYLEVEANSADEGHVYVVCSIKNRGEGTYALKNESRVLNLSDAFDQIPGFKLICDY